MFEAVIPTMRVFWIKNGKIRQKLHEFLCTATPNVGDHINVEGESWPVLKVEWCIGKHAAQYVDVYVVEESYE